MILTEYDINLMEPGTINPLLNKLQTRFTEAGLDPKTVTEDDRIYNLRGKNPDKRDYHGTEGENKPDINLED